MPVTNATSPTNQAMRRANDGPPAPRSKLVSRVIRSPISQQGHPPFSGSWSNMMICGITLQTEQPTVRRRKACIFAQESMHRPTPTVRKKRRTGEPPREPRDQVERREAHGGASPPSATSELAVESGQSGRKSRTDHLYDGASLEFEGVGVLAPADIPVYGEIRDHASTLQCCAAALRSHIYVFVRRTREQRRGDSRINIRVGPALESRCQRSAAPQHDWSIVWTIRKRECTIWTATVARTEQTADEVESTVWRLP